MKSVAVMIADGSEEIEALTVVDVLRRANVKCDIVSVDGRSIKSSHNIEILSDKVIDNSIKEYYQEDYQEHIIWQKISF